MCVCVYIYIYKIRNILLSSNWNYQLISYILLDPISFFNFFNIINEFLNDGLCRFG